MEAGVSFLDQYGMALLAGYFAVYFLMTAGANYVLQTLSDKTDAAPSWVAWIPIVQFHAFIRAFGTSYKALFAWIGGIIVLAVIGGLLSGDGSTPGILVPFVMVYVLCSLVWFASLFWRLAERRGLSGWAGLACFIPVLGLLFYLYIAFHDGFVRPSGIGLAVTVAIGLVAVAGLRSDLQEMRSFMGGDMEMFADDLDPEQQAQFAEMMKQLGDQMAEPERRSGRTRRDDSSAGNGGGMLDRVRAWGGGSDQPSYPKEVVIPDAVVCQSDTRMVGARPPRGTAMWCERRGSGAKHGWHLAWFPNGQLKEAGRYADGKRDGVWTRFWESGGRKAQVEFEGDREHGILVLWDELGRKEREIPYVHGEPGSL